MPPSTVQPRPQVPQAARRPSTRARAYFEQFASEYDDAARESGWRLNGRLAVALAGAGPVRRAVDLACGTGETLDELARVLPGAELVGVDLAAAMVDRSAARVPRATVVRADLARLRGRCPGRVVRRRHGGRGVRVHPGPAGPAPRGAPGGGTRRPPGLHLRAGARRLAAPVAPGRDQPRQQRSRADHLPVGARRGHGRVRTAGRRCAAHCWRPTDATACPRSTAGSSTGDLRDPTDRRRSAADRAGLSSPGSS